MNKIDVILPSSACSTVAKFQVDHMEDDLFVVERDVIESIGNTGERLKISKPNLH